MPSKPPQDTALSVRLIWPFIRVIGGDPSAMIVLIQNGVQLMELADPDTSIAHRTVMKLLASAVASRGDPTLGLKAAQSFGPSDLGVLEYAVRSCATLRGAARCAVRYIRLLNGAAEISLEERGELATWHFRIVDGVVQEPAANDFEVAVFMMLAQRYTGTPHEAPLEVHLAHAVPTSEAEYQRVFGCVPRMGMPHNAIVFKRELLNTPMIHADPTLHTLLDQHVAELLKRQRKNEGIAGRTRALLLANLSSEHTTVGFAAKSLGMSTSTLRRRLEEEGTTHSELLDSVRRELAERYLSDMTLALGEVAFLLGYSHSNSFFKAFRRWFDGRTPTEFRAELRRKPLATVR
jgi:AraC-like DNA-binding protein